MQQHQHVNHSVNNNLLDQDYTYRKLHTEHDRIEEEIQALERRPQTEEQLRALKRKKLAIRDQMQELEKKKFH